MLYNVFGHFGNKNFPLGRFRPQSQNNQINMSQPKEVTPAGFAFRLLVATGNRGKVRELCELLANVPVELVGLGDFPDLKDIEETESTFRGNAELKASGYARQTGMWGRSRTIRGWRLTPSAERRAYTRPGSRVQDRATKRR